MSAQTDTLLEDEPETVVQAYRTTHMMMMMMMMMMRSGTKSDILHCLDAPTCRSDATKQSTVIIFDMAAVINMVRPTVAKHFSQYVSLHIIPFLQSQMSDCTQR